jgi:hypothetical protein
MMEVPMVVLNLFETNYVLRMLELVSVVVGTMLVERFEDEFVVDIVHERNVNDYQFEFDLRQWVPRELELEMERELMSVAEHYDLIDY